MRGAAQSAEKYTLICPLNETGQLSLIARVQELRSKKHALSTVQQPKWEQIKICKSVDP